MMAPKFQELSEKYLDVIFLKLDCNQDNKVGSMIPTLLLELRNVYAYGRTLSFLSLMVIYLAAIGKGTWDKSGADIQNSEE